MMLEIVNNGVYILKGSHIVLQSQNLKLLELKPATLFLMILSHNEEHSEFDATGLIV